MGESEKNMADLMDELTGGDKESEKVEGTPKKKRKKTSAPSSGGVIRTLGGLVGLGIMLVGIVLAVWVFVTIIGYLIEPEKAMPIVDGWEEIVRGAVGDGSASFPEALMFDTSERGKASVHVVFPSSEATTPTLTTAMGVLSDQPTDRVYLARLGSLVLLLILLTIIVRLPLAIVSAGSAVLKACGDSSSSSSSR